MADRYHAPPPGARSVLRDREGRDRSAGHEDTGVQAVADYARWFLGSWRSRGTKASKEAAEIIDLLCGEVQRQARRQRYFQREYQALSRRLHDMRRGYEKQLGRERSIRRERESQLRAERSTRRAYERQLHRQQSHPGQKQRAATHWHGDVPYGPTVAKLLALAVCSESEGEARAAFEKARAVHRQAALVRG